MFALLHRSTEGARGMLNDDLHTARASPKTYPCLASYTFLKSVFYSMSARTLYADHWCTGTVSQLDW